MRSYPVHIPIRIFATSIASLFLMNGVATSCALGNDDELMRTIALGSLSNRDAFQSFKCEFTITQGKAANRQAAIEGGPTIDPVTAHGTWLVDGGRFFYELKLDPNLLANQKTEVIDLPNGAKLRISSITLTPLKILWDGEAGISYHQRHAVGVTTNERPGIAMTPRDMLGMMGPSEALHPANLILGRGQSEGISFEYAGTTNVLGRELYAVNITRRINSSESKTSIGFDPARGFLPIEMTYSSSGENGRGTSAYCLVTDVEQQSNNRWFPMRTVKSTITRTNAADRNESEVTAYEVRVHNLIIPAPKSEELFVFNLPKGTHIQVAETGKLAQLASDRVMKPNTVQPLLEATERAGQLISTTGSGRRWYILLNILIVAVLVSLLLLRKFQRGKTAL